MPYPTKRTDEVVESILSRVRSGEPLAAVCREDGMPSVTAWLNWCHGDEDLAIAYGRAREDGEQAIAAECMEIADDGRNDWMEKHDKDGALLGWQLNGEHVQRSKLRIETRLKLLAKWNPKKWGDKIDMTSNGEKITPDMGDAAARVAALLAVARERKGKEG